MVIHFMLDEVRRKYELEKLWALGEEYDDQSREMKASLLEEESARGGEGGIGEYGGSDRTASSHDQEDMETVLSHDQETVSHDHTDTEPHDQDIPQMVQR